MFMIHVLILTCDVFILYISASVSVWMANSLPVYLILLTFILVVLWINIFKNLYLYTIETYTVYGTDLKINHVQVHLISIVIL